MAKIVDKLKEKKEAYELELETYKDLCNTTRTKIDIIDELIDEMEEDDEDEIEETTPLY